VGANSIDGDGGSVRDVDEVVAMGEVHRSAGAQFRHRLLFSVAVVVAALGLVLTGSPAQAGKGWCRVDPIVVIDGQIADIFVGSTLKALTNTTGPIELVVTVPENVNATKLISDLGFGRGYDFRIVKSAELVKSGKQVPVRIQVYVPAKSDDLPISVYFAPRLLGIIFPESADGYANQWITLNSTV
jgi:hypothetical protein